MRGQLLVLLEGVRCGALCIFEFVLLYNTVCQPVRCVCVCVCVCVMCVHNTVMYGNASRELDSTEPPPRWLGVRAPRAHAHVCVRVWGLLLHTKRHQLCSHCAGILIIEPDYQAYLWRRSMWMAACTFDMRLSWGGLSPAPTPAPVLVPAPPGTPLASAPPSPKSRSVCAAAAGIGRRGEDVVTVLSFFEVPASGAPANESAGPSVPSFVSWMVLDASAVSTPLLEGSRVPEGRGLEVERAAPGRAARLLPLAAARERSWSRDLHVCVCVCVCV